MPKRKHNSNFYRLVNEETCKTLELINISKKVEQDGVYESCGSLDCNNTQIVEHKNHDQQLDKCPTTIEMPFSYCEKMNLEINNDMQYEDQPQIEYKTMANVGPSFKSRLQCWAVEEQITHSALDKILQLLHTIPIKLDLPFSARTLLSTPRNIISKTIRPGSYVHLGVQHAVRTLLSDIFSKLPSNIELLINIDGLPLSKSSSSQFYPIMCSLYGHPETVALIGLYHGYEKPSVANEFLQDFVDDITELIQNGCEIGGKRVDVRVKGFICDAPAKSYVTYCKGHSGYFSCTKCLQKGTYLKGRICFPKTDFIKRTDASFLCKSQPDHHIGTSILEKIPYVGMVSSFPLEYMHLICLGVVKKLLVSIWLFRNPGNKLPAGNIKNISELYKSFKSCCPSEFCRKPRLIEEAKRWKATEFRFFLLYLGPVVLQSYISEEKYLNFLALHVAVRIFASDLHKTKVLFNYAKSLLHYFVQTFGNLYGYEYISHNVHGLLHVHEDVGNFGNLNFYSAFGFENYLQGLKKMVRKADKPLAQICNRIYELHQVLKPNVQSSTVCNYTLHQIHSNGNLSNDLTGIFTEYKTIKFDTYLLSIQSADNFCILKNESVIQIVNICLRNSEVVLVGKEFTKKEDYYVHPCLSSVLGTYFVSVPTDLFTTWPISDINNKLIAFPFNNGYVVTPLLHTSKNN